MGDFVLRTGWTAECGGINELRATSIYPSVVAAAKHANESYSLRHQWKAISEPPRWTLNADWITVYADVRFVGNVTPGVSPVDFLLFEDVTGPCWKLRLAASPPTGKIELVDAAGVVQSSTAGGAVSADTWHSFAIKFKHANSTDIKVWIDLAVKLADTGFDASSGGTTAVCYGYNGEFGRFIDVAHILVGTDDGADIDTNDTQGDTLYARCYQNTTQGGTGDSGDALDGGTTWADAGELPANDANFARYDVDTFGARQKGGQVNCDDGARTGPLGDAAIGALDEIVGAVYVCRARSYQESPSGRRVDLEHYHGSSGSVATSTKYLNLPAVWDQNSNKVHILDAADANCPLVSEPARHGAEIYVGTLAGQGWIGELFACAVFREIPAASRLVCIDGLITDVG